MLSLCAVGLNRHLRTLSLACHCSRIEIVIECLIWCNEPPEARFAEFTVCGGALNLLRLYLQDVMFVPPDRGTRRRSATRQSAPISRLQDKLCAEIDLMQTFFSHQTSKSTTV